MVGSPLRAGGVNRADEAGTMVTKEDITAVKVPVCMVCVENDSLFPDEVREAGKGALDKAGVEHEIEVYPSVPHGESWTSGGWQNVSEVC